ncbi:MAG: hypothetical protein ACXWC0_19570, partial [Burkholderiales bacterium]
DAAVPHLDGRLQPTLDVEEHPWTVRMMADRLEQQLPIDAVERLLDRLPTTALIISTTIPIR